MKTNKTYVLIYFNNRKPLKRAYNTASKAFYDHEADGCTLVELFNSNGMRLSSMKASNETI